jgi:hypothetical protein
MSSQLDRMYAVMEDLASISIASVFLPNGLKCGTMLAVHVSVDSSLTMEMIEQCSSSSTKESWAMT